MLFSFFLARPFTSTSVCLRLKFCAIMCRPNMLTNLFIYNAPWLKSCLYNFMDILVQRRSHFSNLLQVAAAMCASFPMLLQCFIRTAVHRVSTLDQNQLKVVKDLQHENIYTLLRITVIFQLKNLDRASMEL